MKKECCFFFSPLSCFLNIIFHFLHTRCPYFKMTKLCLSLASVSVPFCFSPTQPYGRKYLYYFNHLWIKIPFHWPWLNNIRILLLYKTNGGNCFYNAIVHLQHHISPLCYRRSIKVNKTIFQIQINTQATYQTVVNYDADVV